MAYPFLCVQYCVGGGGCDWCLQFDRNFGYRDTLHFFHRRRRLSNHFRSPIQSLICNRLTQYELYCKLTVCILKGVSRFPGLEF